MTESACCLSLLLLLLQVGLGGLGHMAVKFGVAFGCEVYVISRCASL
jgi:D-arabinose 1-dehydrogenase-like Zn-dependent alcohol dehydrogenase